MNQVRDLLYLLLGYLSGCVLYAEVFSRVLHKEIVSAALCKNPALLLCDEPTGALDSKTGEQVLDLLTRLCHDYNTTVVIITHNASIAPLGNRLIRMRNGSVQEMTVNEHPAKVADITW